MEKFWKISYNIVFIPLFWLALVILSLFNNKIKRGIKGRNGLFTDLNNKLKSLPKGSKKIWFHSSSMGEFEQAKPLITILKEKHPEIKIIVSFFSPSGYDNNLNYKLADLVTYLPFDSCSNAKKFIDMLSPDFAILIRYDIWPNHLWKLKEMNIPVFLVDATMRSNSGRMFPVIKNFHSYLFKNFTGILTISESDKEGFSKFGCNSLHICGDTRYDQVYSKSMLAREKKIIPDEVINGKPVFIAGSSWKTDEDHLIPAFIELMEKIPELILILVPHEPNELNLDSIENELKEKVSHIRFSQLLDYNDENVIIIDCIGMLLSLYSYADVAYVGGGFGEGIHNVLEPATYGIPVIFGPKNENSQEAQILLKRGGGFVIKDKNDLYKYLYTFFTEKEACQKAGEIAGDLVKENTGAAGKIFEYLKESQKLG
jgi:3-deoxy-D-manno-octulosonic-acid transferase